MYIFNNIHDRNYKKVYPDEQKVIFDISSNQIKNSKNNDWNLIEVGDLACVVTSSRKISTFYQVTGIKGSVFFDSTDGEIFLLFGEIVAKLPKELEMQSLFNKYGVKHKYLPKNNFSIGFNVAGLGSLLDGLQVKSHSGLVSLSDLKRK